MSDCYSSEDLIDETDIANVFTISEEASKIHLSSVVANKAATFSANCVACVVKNEENIEGMLKSFDGLGFETACTDDLSDAFEIVSEDPEEWAMVVLVLDQKYSKLELSKWVRLFRLMRHQIPILLVSKLGPDASNMQEPTQLGDCYLRLPQSLVELSECIGLSRDANQKYGLNFSHFQSSSLPRPSRFCYV